MPKLFAFNCLLVMGVFAWTGPYAFAQVLSPPVGPGPGQSYSTTYPNTGVPPAQPGPSQPGPTAPQVWATNTPALPPGVGPYPTTGAGTPPAVGIAPPAVPSNQKLFEDAQIVAIVGDEPILAGDMAGFINQILEQYRGKAPEEELKKQERLIMKKLIEQQADTKLAFLDFMRSVPKEKVGELQGKLNEQFAESQLEGLLKQYKVETPAELEAKLRQYGTSLAKLRRQFGERLLAQQAIRKNVNFNEEVSLNEMLAYYEQQAAEFAFEAKVRWEHLSVNFDRFPSKEEAFRAAAQLGNEVLRGAPLGAVAKRSSHGSDADEGGYHDWTTRGALASETLNAALFSLPPGQLSQIIEDERSFHIVRVIERREAGKSPFEEAQTSIKEKIRKERLKTETEKYLNGLRERTYVWTIFDEAAPGSG